jgi:[acyl-carrier-protein] S-malonyltransferase
LLAALQEALGGPASSPDTFSWSSPLTPAFTAGHSVGEYAALVAAGALDLKDAVTLVRERGRLMHHEGTVCQGGMAAIIAMDEAALQAICQEVTTEATTHRTGTHPGEGQVAIANYNAPGQIVISGEQRALEKAMQVAKARGAKKIMPLAVSAAFHSPVMQPAATGLTQAIAETAVHDAAIPVIGNIEGAPLTEAGAIRAELAQQIAAPVQWTRSIEYIASHGVTVFLEIGPGQALTGMVKRIVRGATLLNVSSAANIPEVVEAVHSGIRE